MPNNETPEFEFTPAALEAIAECGLDPAADYAAVVSRKHNRASLLAACLIGADDDRREGLQDYVDEVCVGVDAEEADPEPNATIYAQGNGFPDVGDYVRHAPTSALYVVDAIVDRIMTGDPRGYAIRAAVSEADDADCEASDEHDARLDL